MLILQHFFKCRLASLWKA